ncbi:MAG: YbaY family lipoprotein, partial [Verrucomicrobiota bacterium]
MKTSLFASLFLLASAGCKNFGQYVDTTPLPTGNQVLNGTVGWPAGISLPADAAVTVLLLDDSNNNVLETQKVEHSGPPP